MDRTDAYLRYQVERGAEARWGPTWATDDFRRPERLRDELTVIVDHMHFSAYFLILQRILQWCRDEQIVYGPGRGSVGGSLVAYCLGIHEADSLEWDLSFDRFLNRTRVSYPDVDLDVSQRHRPRVLDFIRREFEDEHTVVLQVAAFARAGARRTIDMVAAAKRQDDPSAESIATQLKKLLPEGANVTGGVKQDKELTWWLENGKHNVGRFTEIATKAGWLDTLLKLDGVQTHLAKHAAGVVIISREDLARLPQTSADGENMMTGYDMYMLDSLSFLKIDILGLRTLDIVSDAHKFCGGDGTTPELMQLWRRHREDPEPYELLCNADTTGVFQVETPGYRKTLKEFQPRQFEHIVHLNALYRPGALDYEREDGMNMVQVFIARLHGREPITYPAELEDAIKPILRSTQGIILYQEQSMRLVQALAGFDEAQADNLRKAIGKKLDKVMAQIKPQFIGKMKERGYSPHSAETIWSNIEAAGRYSWNMSHCLAEGTLIATERGAVPIERVTPSDIVISRDADGLIRQPVSGVHYNGVQQTYRVILEDGVEISATPNHRLLTKQGYKRVDQMERGDALQVGYDFSPAPHIQILAARVTGPTEGDEIPGWIILYHTERDDMVDWQLAIVDTTDSANPSVALSNCVFRSFAPWVDGVAAPGGTSSIEGMVETRATILHGHEREAFFLGSKYGAQEALYGRRVEAQATRDFRARKLLFEIEAAGLLSHGWSKPSHLAVVGGAAMVMQEAQECVRRAIQTEDVAYLRVAPALGIEIQDLVPSLFEILARQLDSWNLWDVTHAPIPRSRKVRQIQVGPRKPVYDLEMPHVHNFLANGVISHNSVFYGTITWWCAFFKALRHVHDPELGLDGPGTAGFYAALINSLDEDKDRQADAVAEARQHVEIRPPDINIAQESYTVDGLAIVFGLNGIKGMGEANRAAIMVERWLGGPYQSFADFHRRLPSVPINMKLSLVRCGAFDSTDGREMLLATIPRRGPGDRPLLDKEGRPKTWTIAEFIKHNSSLKKPRPMPSVLDWTLPTPRELADGEIETIGFYVSADPMADVTRALKRLDPSCHWGGEIVASSIKTKRDKADQEMGWFTLLTASLNKQRCMVFGSDWPQCKPLVLGSRGKHVIVRGRMDGTQLIVDKIFVAGDYRQFEHMVLWREGKLIGAESFNGQFATVEHREREGFEVQLS